MQMRKCLVVTWISIYPWSAYGWLLDVHPDDMTGKVVRTVSVASENDIILKWPYGTIGARVALRNHPRYGKNILFIADSGQIPCRSYSPCDILVRFDSEPPMRFSGANPSDGSSEAVFIQGYDRFTKSLMKAKKMRIELEFFQNGVQSFIFDVKDFSSSGLTARP